MTEPTDKVTDSLFLQDAFDPSYAAGYPLHVADNWYNATLLVSVRGEGVLINYTDAKKLLDHLAMLVERHKDFVGK